MARDFLRDFGEGATDEEILKAMSGEMQKRYQKRIREAVVKGEKVKELSMRAKEELDRKQEATITAAIAVETGLDANAVEGELGIDLTQTMLGLADTAEYQKRLNARRDIEQMMDEGDTAEDGTTDGKGGATIEDEATDNDQTLTPEEQEKKRKAAQAKLDEQAAAADKARKANKAEAEKRIKEQAEAESAGESETEEGESEAEDGETAEIELTAEEAAAREKEREEARERARQACAELIAKAEERAAKRKADLETARKRRAELAEEKAKAAAEVATAGESEADGGNATDESEDGGDRGEKNGAIEIEELEKAGIDLADPAHVAAFIIELARAKWIKQNGLPLAITDKELWRDRIAVQFLRKTAQNIMTKMAKSMTHSYGREIAMQQINRIDHAPTFFSARRQIEICAAIVRDNMITDRRKKLVKQVEKFIRKEYIRHKEFQNGEEYTKRKVAAETELFMRDVLKVIWYSNAKVERELGGGKT